MDKFLKDKNCQKLTKEIIDNQNGPILTYLKTEIIVKNIHMKKTWNPDSFIDTFYKTIKK